ncbi:hypothetical protein [Pedobacter panaciterrae]|uniref:hypothetical protein n=1 Tax=Pedobacter panaciterrae TaxID=363849 RepID=UPI00259A7C20|nr:hypothetical protein [uncultured Pedobacter sp.]
MKSTCLKHGNSERINLIRAIPIILLLISTVNLSTAQSRHQEATVLAYNVAFSGLGAGIGAVFNKSKSTKWHQAFARGCWQGSIGGLLNYSSKKTLHLISRKQSTFYALPAMILNAASYSIVESAALNRPFMQHWSIDYGLLRIDFSTRNKNDLKLRLLPEAVYASIDAGRHGRFDLETSLLSGNITFKTNLATIPGFDPNLYLVGLSWGRALVYADNITYSNPYYTIAHELVHSYQFREYQIFNTWLYPLSNKVKLPVAKKIFSRYIFFDMPYFWIFYDLEGQKPYPYYYRNFYEFEAERFSTNQHVLVH